MVEMGVQNITEDGLGATYRSGIINYYILWIYSPYISIVPPGYARCACYSVYTVMAVAETCVVKHR